MIKIIVVGNDIYIATENNGILLRDCTISKETKKIVLRRPSTEGIFLQEDELKESGFNTSSVPAFLQSCQNKAAQQGRSQWPSKEQMGILPGHI